MRVCFSSTAGSSPTLDVLLPDSHPLGHHGGGLGAAPKGGFLSKPFITISYSCGHDDHALLTFAHQASFKVSVLVTAAIGKKD